MRTSFKAFREQIVQHARSQDLAFLVGNGINLYPNKSKDRSWDQMLLKLHNKFAPHALSELPISGMTLTELYDLIILNSKGQVKKSTIQSMVVAEMQKWKPGRHHFQIVDSIRRLEAPILTTNFDDLMARASSSSINYTIPNRKRDWTASYPWQAYYSTGQFNRGVGFGIWHVHGMIKYPQSIRLGLTDYLRTFAKAERLRPKRVRGIGATFLGSDTWLRHFFDKSLVIFGLRLGQDEVFLRWLLIERAKHVKRTGRHNSKGWYISTDGLKPDIGHKFFLNGVGFELVTFPNHKDFYKTFWTTIGQFARTR